MLQEKFDHLLNQKFMGSGTTGHLLWGHYEDASVRSAMDRPGQKNMQCLIKRVNIYSVQQLGQLVLKNVLNIFDHQHLITFARHGWFQDDDACQVSLRLPFQEELLKKMNCLHRA